MIEKKRRGVPARRREERTGMGWMGSLVNGLSGNLNEISPQETEKEFGAFLMEGEAVQACFRLVRDVLIVTDKRILIRR